MLSHSVTLPLSLPPPHLECSLYWNLEQLSAHLYVCMLMVALTEWHSSLIHLCSVVFIASGYVVVIAIVVVGGG